MDAFRSNGSTNGTAVIYPHSPLMGDNPDYEALAQVARRQAKIAATPATRRALLEIAEKYERLAKAKKP